MRELSSAAPTHCSPAPPSPFPTHLTKSDRGPTTEDFRHAPLRMNEWLIDWTDDKWLNGWMNEWMDGMLYRDPSVEVWWYFEIWHFEQKIGNLGLNIRFNFNWMNERWMECSHHYPFIQICSFWNLPKIWENLVFPKKQGICGEIFPFHFYFLHLCQISGTKYGRLETVVFSFQFITILAKVSTTIAKLVEFTLWKTKLSQFFGVKTITKFVSQKTLDLNLAKLNPTTFRVW